MTWRDCFGWCRFWLGLARAVGLRSKPRPTWDPEAATKPEQAVASFLGLMPPVQTWDCRECGLKVVTTEKLTHKPCPACARPMQRQRTPVA